MRDALKEPQSALPYWDATRDRRIPAAYWGKDNPLYDTTREMDPALTDGAGVTLPVSGSFNADAII